MGKTCTELFAGIDCTILGNADDEVNGIAYRRWLCQANPALTDYLTKLIGDGFTKDARELEKLCLLYTSPSPRD